MGEGGRKTNENVKSAGNPALGDADDVENDADAVSEVGENNRPEEDRIQGTAEPMEDIVVDTDIA